MPLSTAPGLSPAESSLANKAEGAPQAPSVPITPPIGSQKSVTAPPPIPQGGLDPQVVKVAQAIRNVESQGNFNAIGDNGSSLGAYQWNNGKEPVKPGETPINWQNAAKQYLGSADAPMTPENQNFVAYSQIKAYKDQGLSPVSIDALWNGAKPDPANPGQYTHVNPSRATEFNNALQNIVQGTPQNNPQQPYQAPNQITGDQSQPSALGFGENVVKSGANFLGNIANAAIHPIQTVQNLGSMAAGGLQELGGQQNQNTQAFDTLKNYLGQRYGSPQNLVHTAYTDPIGLAGDIAAVFGAGEGLAGAASKGAEVAGLTRTAGVASDISSGLGEASRLANPLTPIIAGGSKLLSLDAVKNTANEALGQFFGQSGDVVKFIQEHPEMITDETLKNTSRIGIANEIEATLQSKMAALSETGSGYTAFKETPTAFQTSPDFLDNAFRKAGVEVNDGVLSGTSQTEIRASSDINKLQDVYNRYKPDFLNGTMDSNKLLNLRNDLRDLSFNDNGFRNTKLASAGENIASNLNDTYRSKVPNLEQTDTQFSAQKSDLKRLAKGFINQTGDKKGELTDAAINKIANAGGKGKDATLARLEELMPGITLRLQALKVIEDLNNTGIKVGSYTRSIMQAGRLGATVLGAATGNIKVLAGALVMDFIARPDTAIPIIKALAKARPELIAPIMTNLAKYATVGSLVGRVGASQSGIPQSPQGNTGVPQTIDQIGGQQSSPTPAGSSSINDITQTPGYQEAINAGYSPQEIQQHLVTQ